MSISYSAITNYGRSTLPSVEAGLGSMIIQKDPPKSIMTRRIDKVGETSSLTELCDQSGDRVCEGISLYARGVNPFVSVSYGNEGNNGGQRSNNTVGKNGGKQAFLPYTIMRDGVFRPPVLTQEQLMPLSRQPRTNTDAFTQPGFIDFSKKLICPGTTYREVKQDTLKTCVRPTATYRLDTPLTEPFEIKYVIKNPVKFDSSAGSSGIRTQDLTTQDVKEPGKGLYENPIHVKVVPNRSGETVRYADNSEMNTERYLQDPLHTNVQINRSGETTRYVDNSEMDTERYLQDPLHTNVQINRAGETTRYADNSHFDTDRYLQDPLNKSIQSKKSQSIHITPIEDIMNLDAHTKDSIHISYTAPKTGNTKEDHIHDDISLQRRTIMTSAPTNKQLNIYVRPQVQYQSEQKRNRPLASAITNHGTVQHQSIDNLSSREFKLNPTISAGSFTGRGQIPLQKRISSINDNIETEKAVMGKKVMEMQHSRVF